MSDLAASRCARCARDWVPARERCPQCAGRLDPTRVPGEGKLVTWTTVHASPEGRPAGYSVGVVDLPGARVVAAADAGTPLAFDVPVVVREDGGRLVFRAR